MPYLRYRMIIKVIIKIIKRLLLKIFAFLTPTILALIPSFLFEERIYLVDHGFHTITKFIFNPHIFFPIENGYKIGCLLYTPAAFVLLISVITVTIPDYCLPEIGQSECDKKEPLITGNKFTIRDLKSKIPARSFRKHGDTNFKKRCLMKKTKKEKRHEQESIKSNFRCKNEYCYANRGEWPGL